MRKILPPPDMRQDLRSSFLESLGYSCFTWLPGCVGWVLAELLHACFPGDGQAPEESAGKSALPFLKYSKFLVSLLQMDPLAVPIPSCSTELDSCARLHFAVSPWSLLEREFCRIKKREI